jgi:hypothetical protein
VATTSDHWYGINGLASGTYTVKVVDKNGCETICQHTVAGGQSIGISVNSTPAACGQSNGSIGIDIVGGMAPFKIYLNGTLVATTSDRWYGITGIATGVYTVKVIDKNGCEATCTHTVIGGALISVITTSGGAACGQSTGSISVDISGGMAPFKIYLNGTLVATTSDRWYIINGLAPGTFTVRVVDKNGCEVSRQETVSGGASVWLTTSSGSCGCGQNNGSINVEISGGTAPFKIYLNGNLITTTNDRYYVLANLASGTYSVKIVDKNGCEDQRQQNVSGASSVSISTSATGCGCTHANGTLTVDIAGGTQPFQIFLDGNLVATTSDRRYTITGLSAGTFTVRVVDSHGCQHTHTQVVAGAPALDITASSTHAACGQSNGSIAVDIAGGTPPFKIYSNGTLVATTSDRWHTISSLPSGSYTIRVTDANGCEDTSQLSVGTTQSMSPSTRSTACGCGPANGTISFDIAGGSAPFAVLLNGLPAATISARSYVLNGLSPGTYTLTVRDAGGCEVTRTQVVQGSTAVQVTVTPTPSACGQANGKLDLQFTDGDAPFTIFLNGNLIASTSDRTYSIQNLAPGSYDISVADSHNCQSLRQQLLGSQSEVVVAAVVTDAVCAQTGLIRLDIQRGIAPYFIQINGRLIDSTSNSAYTIGNLLPGAYQLLVRDKPGCEKSIDLTVNGSVGFGLLTQASPDTCAGSTGSIYLQLNGGAVPFSIFLNGNQVATTSNFTYAIPNLRAGTYSLEVRDAQSCSQRANITVANSGQLPYAFFTADIKPGGVVKFNASNSIGTPSWNFGDGSTSLDLNPTHMYNVNYSYIACLTTTNFCGSSTHCDTLFIPNLFNSNLTFRLKDVSGAVGDTVDVPVFADNFDRVGSFAFSLKIDNQQVGQFTGISHPVGNQISSTVVNGQTMTISWNSTNPSGSSLPNGALLFNLRVKLVGGVGACTRVSFEDSPVGRSATQLWFSTPTQVNANYINAEAVCISNNFSISGTVIREDRKAIPNARMTFNNSGFCYTDTQTGSYRMDNLTPGSTYLVIPTKDGDDRLAVNVCDVVAVKRNIGLSRILDSPYKMIAADVNRNGLVNDLDITMMSNLIKGDNMEYPSGDSWRFIPADWQFQNPRDPFQPSFPVLRMVNNLQSNRSGVDFIGMKLGDVDNSHIMQSGSNPQSITQQLDTLAFSFKNQPIQYTQIVEMEITSPNFTGISGFQMEMRFDPALLEYVEAIPAGLPGFGMANLGFSKLDQGIITLLWFDQNTTPGGISLAPSLPLYRLKFRSLTNRTDLTGLISLTRTLTPPLGVTFDDRQLDISLSMSSVTTATDDHSQAGFRWYPVQPNPFSDRALVSFELPFREKIQLTVYDQYGHACKELAGEFPTGFHQMEINAADLRGSGMYFVRMRSTGFDEVQKLIFVE